METVTFTVTSMLVLSCCSLLVTPSVVYNRNFDRSIVKTMPEDTAPPVDQRARLPCTLVTGANYDSVTWEVMLVGESSVVEVLFGRKGSKARVNDNRFEYDTSRPYDLIIKTMTYDMAGVYMCTVRDAATNTAKATIQVVAVGTPVCSTVGVPSISVNESALDCYLEYRALVSQTPLVLHWYNSTHDLLNSTHVFNNKTAVSVRLDTSGSQRDSVYTCRAFMKADTNLTESVGDCRQKSLAPGEGASAPRTTLSIPLIIVTYVSLFTTGTDAV